MEEVKERTGATDVVSDVNVAKVSAIGVGMRNHSGVAARAFSALTQEGINILMISTSEIKITILIQEKYVELAVHPARHLRPGLGHQLVPLRPAG